MVLFLNKCILCAKPCCAALRGKAFVKQLQSVCMCKSKRIMKIYLLQNCRGSHVMIINNLFVCSERICFLRTE